MNNLWSAAMALAVVSVSIGAATSATESERAIRLAPSDPAASTQGDHVRPDGTHLTVYAFNAPGAKSVGLSLLDGPSYPIILGRSAEIFYVYDGSASITQLNQHDVPVRKGDIVFVPRGVAYGGKNFSHYKHAYLVFDPGKTAVPGAPSEVTVLHPNLLRPADLEREGPLDVRYLYHGADGSSIRVWEPLHPTETDSTETRVVGAGEFTVVLRGTITLQSDGGTWTAHAGDVYFVPKGTSLSYTSRDLRAITAVASSDVREEGVQSQPRHDQ